MKEETKKVKEVIVPKEKKVKMAQWQIVIIVIPVTSQKNQKVIQL